MDIDEHAHRRKMNSFRYNKLAAIFTKALDQSWERMIRLTLLRIWKVSFQITQLK